MGRRCCEVDDQRAVYRNYPHHQRKAKCQEKVGEPRRHRDLIHKDLTVTGAIS
jgi:hypothetical protein